MKNVFLNLYHVFFVGCIVAATVFDVEFAANLTKFFIWVSFILGMPVIIFALVLTLYMDLEEIKKIQKSLPNKRRDTLLLILLMLEVLLLVGYGWLFYGVLMTIMLILGQIFKFCLNARVKELENLS